MRAAAEITCRLNREVPWHVLGMYDEVGKLLNCIKNIHLNNLGGMGVRDDESDDGKGYAMSWLLHEYVDGENGIEIFRRGENGNGLLFYV